MPAGTAPAPQGVSTTELFRRIRRRQLGIYLPLNDAARFVTECRQKSYKKNSKAEKPGPLIPRSAPPARIKGCGTPLLPPWFAADAKCETFAKFHFDPKCTSQTPRHAEQPGQLVPPVNHPDTCKSELPCDPLCPLCLRFSRLFLPQKKERPKAALRSNPKLETRVSQLGTIAQPPPRPPRASFQQSPSLQSAPARSPR